MTTEYKIPTTIKKEYGINLPKSHFNNIEQELLQPIQTLSKNHTQHSSKTLINKVSSKTKTLNVQNNLNI